MNKPPPGKNTPVKTDSYLKNGLYEIAVQRATPEKPLPSTMLIKRWAIAALQEKITAAELTIRIVTADEITELNSQYRHKNKPTNVLSFPLQQETCLVGDIVICAEVVKAEALAQHKSEKSHWAHLVVHGTLHLLGYDHENNQDADIMEAEEIHILKTLGFNNPYTVIQEDHNNAS